MDNPQVEHLQRVDDPQVQSGTTLGFKGSTSWVVESVDELVVQAGWMSRENKLVGLFEWTSRMD